MGREDQPDRAFKYSIIDDEDEQILGYCGEVAGLSGDVLIEAKIRKYHRIELKDCYLLGRLASACRRPQSGEEVMLGNLRVAILNGGQEAIGSYFFATAKLLECHRPNDEGLVHLVLAGHLLSPAHPRALLLWDTWRTRRPEENGLWIPLSTEERTAWLEIVRLYDAERRRDIRDRSLGAMIELDGANITDFPGFFCALGEAINGPGGYFGADLDGLNDCLRGGFGIVSPFTVRWLKPEVARRSLVRRWRTDSEPMAGEQFTEDSSIPSSTVESSLFDEIISVFRDGGVTVEFVEENTTGRGI